MLEKRLILTSAYFTLVLELRSAAVVVLDGCSVEARRAARTPFLDATAEAGCATFACKSVFPTATFTAHASLITGAYPREHGIVGNSFYDRSRGTVVNFDVEDVGRYLLARTVMEVVGGTSVAVGEPVARGADAVVSKLKVQREKLFSQDYYALRRAAELVREHKPSLVVVNLPGIDAIGELYGPLSKEVVKHLEGVDELLRTFDDVLREVYEDHLLVVLADHGMAPVGKKLDLSELLEGLEAVICPSHRAAHIYIEPSELEEAIDRLESDRKIELVLSRDELGEHKLDSARSGDIVVVAARGYELGPKLLKGSHGGLTEDELLVPLIANKPEYADLVRKNEITVVPEIVARYVREAKLVAIARNKLEETDPAHGWAHAERMLNVATFLALKYGANVEAVRLACILHDVERGLEPRGHEERSAELAEKLLRQELAPEELVEKVVEVILKHHADPSELESLEEKIVWDADKLDALGLIGFARCLLEAGFHRKGIGEAVEHLLRDARDFSNSMHFEETRRLAEEKLSKVEKLLEELKFETLALKGKRRSETF